MPPTSAQRRASAKYQKENISSLACRIKKEQAEKFKAYCADKGKTSNAVLKDYVLACIDEKIARDLNQPLRSVLRRENVSGIELPSETEKAAKTAAEQTKESVNAFIARAIETQIERDGRLLRIGVNPATGEKLAKASEEKAADSDKDKPADGQAVE